MATLSGIPAWKIPQTEEPGRLHSPWGYKESATTERLGTRHSIGFPGGSVAKNPPGSRRLRLDPGVQKIPWRRK